MGRYRKVRTEGSAVILVPKDREERKVLLREGLLSMSLLCGISALDEMMREEAEAIATLAEVRDRTAAEALKGTRLYVPRERLPQPDEDEFYAADLVGLRVELADGSAFGTVAAVFDFGAGDVLEVARPDGRPEMLPFTRTCVPVVDVAGGRVVVALPEVIEVRSDRDADGTDE